MRDDLTSLSQVSLTLTNTQILKWNWSLQRLYSHKSIFASYSSMINQYKWISKWMLKLIYMNNVKLDKLKKMMNSKMSKLFWNELDLAFIVWVRKLAIMLFLGVNGLSLAMKQIVVCLIWQVTVLNQFENFRI